MITIYTIPKDFTGQFRFIQRNAIKSWLALGAKVFLFGDDKGVHRLAGELRLKWQPRIKKNSYGTPLISDAVRQIKILAQTPVIAYVNCDIILLPDFIQAIKKVTLDNYLIVGQRRPLNMNRQLVGRTAWRKKIETLIVKQNSRPTTGGSDYFIYPRRIDFPMPPFAVGRLFWDSWFMWYARTAGIPIINATEVITAIHQQHYRGFEKHSYGELNLGKEAQINLRHLGRRSYSLKVYDADYLLTKQGLVKPPLTLNRLIRRSEIYLMLNTQKHKALLPALFVVEELRRLYTRYRLRRGLTAGK